jgi:hypothetical protein
MSYMLLPVFLSSPLPLSCARQISSFFDHFFIALKLIFFFPLPFLPEYSLRGSLVTVTPKKWKPLIVASPRRAGVPGAMNPKSGGEKKEIKKEGKVFLAEKWREQGVG